MMVKAQVSPGLGAKTKPQIEQRSKLGRDALLSQPTPITASLRGQRSLRSTHAASAGPINFEREGVMHELGVEV